MNAWDREEEQLYEDLQSGSITQAEFNKQLRELQRDYRESARDSAQDAYDAEMDRW